MLSPRLTSATLKRLELLRINAQKSMLGLQTGKHLSPKRGHGMEFAEYRNYVPGDNPRHIDWGVYGRTDKMYVRVFHEEQNISILFLLDTSNSMRASTEEAASPANKWRFAKDLLLALAYISLAEQETVHLCAPGAKTSSRAYRGISSIFHLHTALETVADQSLSQLETLQRTLSSFRLPGVGVFISDFLTPLEEIEKIFGLLRARNLETCVIQVLGNEDRDPLRGATSALVKDSETGEELEVAIQLSDYQEALAAHTNSVRALCEKRQLRFTTVASADDLLHFISHTLVKSGLVR